MEKGGHVILSTASISERSAKPTYTEPEDDTKVGPSLDSSGNRQTAAKRRTQSSSSSTQWRPKLRHEKYYSSVAGDTSEASTTMLHLGSIDEWEGDAVRAWSDKPVYRQQCLMCSAWTVLESMRRLLEGLLTHPLLLPGTTVPLMIDWWTTV